MTKALIKLIENLREQAYAETLTEKHLDQLAAAMNEAEASLDGDTKLDDVCGIHFYDCLPTSNVHIDGSGYYAASSDSGYVLMQADTGWYVNSVDDEYWS